MINKKEWDIFLENYYSLRKELFGDTSKNTELEELLEKASSGDKEALQEFKKSLNPPRMRLKGDRQKKFRKKVLEKKKELLRRLEI
ncbi:MAG: hypothetical protein EOM19_01855 [Candidatus Moranbacteria bacterium]|nr:hypothetical protein [Candidatus Moranbacteria bacterium]